MTAIYIIGSILALIAFIGLGYYLWSVSQEKYDYNIFNLGVIIRGLISAACIYLGFMMMESDDGSSMVFLIVAAIMWVWTFIVTAIKTNIFIALFSVVYQLIAVFLIRSVIKKIFAS